MGDKAIEGGGRQGRLIMELHTCVPYLKTDDCVGIAVDDSLGHETRSDGGCCLGGIEGPLAISGDERGLADALGAEDDYFGLERGHDGDGCGYATIPMYA